MSRKKKEMKGDEKSPISEDIANKAEIEADGAIFSSLGLTHKLGD